MSNCKSHILSMSAVKSIIYFIILLSFACSYIVNFHLTVGTRFRLGRFHPKLPLRSTSTRKYCHAHSLCHSIQNLTVTKHPPGRFILKSSSGLFGRSTCTKRFPTPIDALFTNCVGTMSTSRPFFCVRNRLYFSIVFTKCILGATLASLICDGWLYCSADRNRKHMLRNRFPSVIDWKDHPRIK